MSTVRMRVTVSLDQQIIPIMTVVHFKYLCKILLIAMGLSISMYVCWSVTFICTGCTLGKKKRYLYILTFVIKWHHCENCTPRL